MKATKTLLALSILAAAGSANATTWDLDLSTNTFFAAANGNLTMAYTGNYDDVAGTGSITGVTTLAAFNVVMNITGETFNMNTATGNGTLNKVQAPATCTDNSTPAGASCGAFTAVLKGPIYNAINFSQNTIPGVGDFNTSTGNAFTPIDGGSFTWTAVIQTLDNASGLLVLNQLPLSVTLHAQQTAVPIPAAAWLFGSGLFGLAGTARRRRAASTAKVA